MKTEMCSWPSGLRRCIKAAVSSEAWVRIPSNTISFSFKKAYSFICLFGLNNYCTLSNLYDKNASQFNLFVLFGLMIFLAQQIK